MYYYKFNIADWNLSTAHLSLEEEAIYFRLINYYYDTQSPIPIKTQSVFRRLRLASQDKATAILNEFFVKTDNGWIHNRCEKVLKEYRKTAKKNKINGAKGGRPSKNAASSITHTEPTGLPDESQNNPNQEPTTKNHKPITKVKTVRFKKPTRDQLVESFGDRVVNPKQEAEKFWNHYESNGWRVGRTPMKSWTHAVTNWITRSKSNGSHQQSPKESRSERIEREHREYIEGLGQEEPDGTCLAGTEIENAGT